VETFGNENGSSPGGGMAQRKRWDDLYAEDRIKRDKLSKLTSDSVLKR